MHLCSFRLRVETWQIDYEPGAKKVKDFIGWQSLFAEMYSISPCLTRLILLWDWKCCMSIDWRWPGCIIAPIFPLLIIFTTKLAKHTMSYRATVYLEEYARRTGVVEPQLPSGQWHVAILSVRLPHLFSHSMMLNIGITLWVARIKFEVYCCLSLAVAWFYMSSNVGSQ